MRTIKIVAGNSQAVENDKIVVIPDALPSDIPYYFTVNKPTTNSLDIKNYYASTDERLEVKRVGQVEISIGIKSGKVYELKSLNSSRIEVLKSSIDRLILSFKSSGSDNLGIRKRNNLKFSSEILKQAISLSKSSGLISDNI